MRALVDAILARNEPACTTRAEFAITAIYCQVNEGISPSITATLNYENFHFGRRWVEFPPRSGLMALRRRLSQETAKHLQEQMLRLKAKAGDLIHSHIPRWAGYHRKGCKPYNWNEAIESEVRLAGFDPKRFTGEKLKWLWRDSNPDLRDGEIRAEIVASFILKWAKIHQQEALLRLLYEQLQLLRPSWAYPKYVADPTCRRKGTCQQS